MGLNVHTIDQIDGSQFNRQDRVLMGMLSGVATPSSATSVTVLGAITAGTGFTNISTVTLAPPGAPERASQPFPHRSRTYPTRSGRRHRLRDQRHYHTRWRHARARRNRSRDRPDRQQGPAHKSRPRTRAGPVTRRATPLRSRAAPRLRPPSSRSIPSPPGPITTFHVSTAGVYTAEASSFTRHPLLLGYGATFQTAVWGVQAVTVSTAGAYAAVPASPAAQGSTSGTGTGATFTGVWGLGTAQITASGNYTGARP